MAEDIRHQEVKAHPSHDTFLEIYETYADPIFRFCLTKVRNRDLATDLTQDTFTKTWEYLASGKDIDAIRPFLYRVARNLIIDQSRRKTAISLDALTAEGGDIRDEAMPTFGLSFDTERALKLVEGLDRKYREPLMMRYVDDLTIVEIARILRVTENVVSVRLHRGIKQLQSMIPDQTYV